MHAIDSISWTYGVLCVHEELVALSILHTMMFIVKGGAFGLIKNVKNMKVIITWRVEMTRRDAETW